MGVLEWGKPARAIPHEEWLKLSADGAPPGVYSPNMSQQDAQAWKAKMAGQRSGGLRTEIRKTAGSQLLVTAWEDGRVQLSANGQVMLSQGDWIDMRMAIAEAREEMSRWRAAHPVNGGKESS